MTTTTQDRKVSRPPDEKLSKEAYHYIEQLETDILTLKMGMRLLLLSIDHHALHWDIGEDRRSQEVFQLAELFKLY